MTTLNLSDRDATAIVAALLTVAPSGGSSPQYRLALAVAEAANVDVTSDDVADRINQFARTLLTEATA